MEIREVPNFQFQRQGHHFPSKRSSSATEKKNSHIAVKERGGAEEVGKHLSLASDQPEFGSWHIWFLEPCQVKTFR